MEIRLINSEKFYIIQQEDIFYKRYVGNYNGIIIESINCPEYDDEDDVLLLRGDWEHRNVDNVKVPRKKMAQVLTALSLCCLEHSVTLTIKL